MKRPSYRTAVAWIALNDAVGDDDPADVLSGLVSVALVADLFEISPTRVAADVLKMRRREGLTKH